MATRWRGRYFALLEKVVSKEMGTIRGWKKVMREVSDLEEAVRRIHDLEKAVIELSNLEQATMRRIHDLEKVSDQRGILSGAGDDEKDPSLFAESCEGGV